jgi:tRNA(Ile)-lysidine synthase
MLRATCVAAGQGWVEDPSNLQCRFARTRLRNLGAALAVEGLTAERLAAVARRARRARQALDHGTAKAVAAACAMFPEGYALLDLERLADAPEEIRLRALARSIGAIGAKGYPPRSEALEGLAFQIFGEDRGKARTLGGCIFSAYRGRLLVRREQRAIAGPERLTAGVPVRWDGRFLAVARAGAGDLTIRRFDAAARAALAQKPPHLKLSMVPALVRTTLPAVYDPHGLAAVPHLGYARPGLDSELVTVSFAPEQGLTGPD